MKIEVNGTLVFEIKDKRHWINSFPGALPTLPMSEKLLWVDNKGNTATIGEDFRIADEFDRYPIKIYWLERTAHFDKPEYVQKIKNLFYNINK